MNTILVLDTSYTLKMIKDRKLHEAILSRKVGGFFKTVISVHPLSGLFEKNDKKFGNPIISKIDNNHYFISGKIGIAKFLNIIPPLNFILSQLKLIKLLIKLSSKYKVNVIRIGDPYYLGIIGLILSRIMKIPLVIRVGSNFDTIYEETKRPIFKKIFIFRFVEKIIEKYIFSKCDLVAAANKNYINYAIANGAQKKNTTIFRYGNLIHANHWLDPKKRKLPKNFLKKYKIIKKKFIVVISRLEKEKKIETIIKTAHKLKKKINIGLKFLIIGDGTELNNLKKLSKKLNVEKEIIFTGNKDQIWISRILPYCLTVLSPHGGRSLTEACLSGVPIIAFNFDWQKELIKNDKTGFLIKNGQWENFVKKIIFILENKKRAEIIGKNARAEVLKTMNPFKLANHEKLHYRKIIKKNKLN